MQCITHCTPNAFFVEFDKGIPTEYHMHILNEGSSKDLQYEDKKPSLAVLKQMNDMYKQPKIPLPTPSKVPRLIEEESISGELSILIYV